MIHFKAGGVKRNETHADEEMLFMRTVRDMNLSKLVSDDVPLFLALLKDLFPRIQDPPKKCYERIEKGIAALLPRKRLVARGSWILKIIQLYEANLMCWLIYIPP